MQQLNRGVLYTGWEGHQGIIEKKRERGHRSRVSGTSKTEPGGHAEANKGAPHAESGGNLKQSQATP